MSWNLWYDKLFFTSIFHNLEFTSWIQSKVLNVIKVVNYVTIFQYEQLVGYNASFLSTERLEFMNLSDSIINLEYTFAPKAYMSKGANIYKFSYKAFNVFTQ